MDDPVDSSTTSLGVRGPDGAMVRRPFPPQGGGNRGNRAPRQSPWSNRASPTDRSRIGGQVISVLKEEQADDMKSLAEELGFEFNDIEIQPEMLITRTEDGEVDLENADVEKLRRYLEDTMSLLSVEEVPEENPENAVLDVEYEEEDDVDELGDVDNEEHFQ